MNYILIPLRIVKNFTRECKKIKCTSFVTADPDMCHVLQCVSHNHVFFFVLWIGHQVHRRSEHAATRRLRSGYPVVRCVSCYDSYAVTSLPHVIWTRKKNNGSEGDRDLADEGRSIVHAFRPEFRI